MRFQTLLNKIAPLTPEIIKRFLIFIRQLGINFSQNNSAIRASSLAFKTLFCVVPFFVITYSIFSMFPGFENLSSRFHSKVIEFIAAGKEDMVKSYISAFTSQARNLSAAGMIFLIITLCVLMYEAESAFNNIWGVKRRRSGFYRILLYWAVITLGPIFIGASMVLSSYLFSFELIAKFDQSAEPMLGLKLTPLLLTTLGFFIIYRVIPNAFVRPKSAFIGAFFVAIAFELGKKGFASFVSLSPTYDLLYGTFAIIPLFLLWMYLCWLIILFGAELVCHIENFTQAHKELNYPELIEILTLLKFFYDAHNDGCSLNKDRIYQRTGFAFSEYQWNKDIWTLIRLGWISKTENNHYVLKQNLSQTSLYQLIQKLDKSLPDANAMMKEGLNEPWQKQLIEKLTQANLNTQKDFGGSIESFFKMS